jgi:NAD(P)-dependent dehydrogenase (short-subunit alcohol dehydrogenase family)
MEDWDKLFALTAKSTFLCYKYAAQQMIRQGRGGRIIGASSLSGKQGERLITSELPLTGAMLIGSINASVYCRTKFAIRGITRAAGMSVFSEAPLCSLIPLEAKEFGQYGITVNAYAPGAIEDPCR